MIRVALIVFSLFTALMAFLFLMVAIDKIVRPNYKNLNDSEFTIVAVCVSTVVLSNILLLKKFWKRYKPTSNLNRSVWNNYYMTIYEFIKLDLNERANATWNGTFIAERQTTGERILLYKLNDFFIEVFYDFKNNRIVKIRPFNSTDLLEPYLEQVNINDILIK